MSSSCTRQLVLGEGSHGSVRVCRHQVSGREFACKTISSKSQHDIAHANAEIASLLRLQQGRLAEIRSSSCDATDDADYMDVADGGHPNVVSLYGFFQDQEGIHLILELCAGGDLFDRMVSTPEARFSEAEAKDALRAVCQGLLFCHRNGVVHRDVKLENILLPRPDSPLSHAKLADFGASLVTCSSCACTSASASAQYQYPPPPRQHQHRHSFSDADGTPEYMAPELLMIDQLLHNGKSSSNSFDEKVDVWSAGMLLFLMLVGEHPLYYLGTSAEDILQAVKVYHSLDDLVRSTWDRVVPEEAKGLLRGMLQREPSRRLELTQILAHPWLLRASSCCSV